MAPACAQVVEANNEDGQLVCEVQYYTPLPRLVISDGAKQEFIEISKHTHVHENIACVFCGSDSQFRTDNGPMCEQHLLITSWNEAVRI